MVNHHQTTRLQICPPKNMFGSKPPPPQMVPIAELGVLVFTRVSGGLMIQGPASTSLVVFRFVIRIQTHSMGKVCFSSSFGIPG